MEETMIILIVDDQTNVVSGLISGINWERLQVKKVLKAYNAFEAKAILESQSVDIMLCDIEMPAEDGISLLRWIKKMNINTECIFLTAHADFMYAKEAIKLGGFDYILQPARYEDIENSIIRAQDKIISNRRKQEFSSYGQILYEKKDMLIDSILRDWFLGKETEMIRNLSDFKKLDIKIDSNSRLYLVLFNILRWHPQAEHWETQLFKASVNNIVSELYEHYGQSVLLAELDEDNYIFILYHPHNQLIDEEGLIRQLEYFIQICKNFFQCSISCYTGSSTSPGDLAGKAKQLLKMKNDNVTLISKVFFYEKRKIKNEETHELYNMKHLSGLLVNGGVLKVKEEILSYLKKLSESERLDSDGLKRFYQNYLQMLFYAAEQTNISLNTMFQDKDILEKSLNSYNTIDQMVDFIHLSLDFFEHSNSNPADTKNQIDQIIQYIHNNIEKDIRRNEIADAVFLNPDYLSRLFKKEVGVPLKEYIMLCKMKEAQALLKTTNLPISMIAVKVGYTNFSHFSQVYKKMLGVTPVEDRSN
jgi:two-component system, response regulator YesN